MNSRVESSDIPSTFPTGQRLYEGAIVGAIADAILVASQTDVDIYRVWTEQTYVGQIIDGDRAAMTFLGDRVVGVAWCPKSNRSPYRGGDRDWSRYFAGAPSDVIQIAETITFRHMRSDLSGENMTLITTAFWGDRRALTAAEPWSSVFAEGGVALEFEALPLESALDAWAESYGMTAAESALLRGLATRRLAAGETPIELTPDERDTLFANGAVEPETLRPALASAGLLLPR